MANVKLCFEDGETFQFTAKPDQSILSAAYEAGLPLARDCEMGDCQTCRARILSGEIELDELAFITLEDDEVAEGAILQCVSMPVSDVEIELPYNRAHLKPVKTFEVTIAEVKPLAETTWILRGQISGGGKLDFLPGQYVNIAIPGTDATRSYSMSSAPSSPRDLEFLIRILPDGIMSDYLRNNARSGEKLSITGPHGVFYLRQGAGPVMMVAGGTGLAPMVSMLRTLLAKEDTARAITLCFGVNTQADLFYLDELEKLKQAFKQLDLRFAVVEPGPDWSGAAGFVTDLLQPNDITENLQAYLCGPPPMIKAARSWFQDNGLAREHIFAEEFIPSE